MYYRSLFALLLLMLLLIVDGSTSAKVVSSLGSLKLMQGGKPVKIGAYPSFVKVFDKRGRSCGGVIIKPNIVLTAAVCIVDDSTYNVTTSVYQSKNKAYLKSIQTIGVKNYCKAENFTRHSDSSSSTNDYALLVLEKSLSFNKFVRAASLASKALKTGDLAITVGLESRENLRRAQVRSELCPEGANYTGNACFRHGDSHVESGDTGNPVYIKRSGKLELVAIHNGNFIPDKRFTWATDLFALKDSIQSLMDICGYD